jgi:hypothetical protein
MLFERRQIETRFRDMPDEELLRQMAEALPDLEREVALEEAGRRGLYLQALHIGDRDSPMEVPAGHGPLQVCARYLNPLDAQVLAGCLQNQGIAARVMDSDSLSDTGAAFGSLPRGGVRVMVPQSQLTDAIRIVTAFDAGELAIDEDYDVGKE